MNLDTNTVKIVGEIISKPVFCHTTHDEDFFSFNVKTPRKSGTDDIVPVLISEKIMKNIEIGKIIKINGQIRTYNQQDMNNSNSKKLLIYAFVLSYELLSEAEEENNVVTLKGFICKAPIYRTTPFGREITDLLLAVNRSYYKSDYIPCISWGRNAVFAKDFSVGQQVEITGRLQSRDYNKKLPDGSIVVKTAYEVSIANIKTIEQEQKESN